MKKRIGKSMLAVVLLLQVISTSVGTIAANDEDITKEAAIQEKIADRDENKDGIADKYQVKVIYKAVNGSIDAEHVNEENRTFYVNLYKDGNLATVNEGGVGYLSEDQIATATAANGYAQDTLSWYPCAPTTEVPLQYDTGFEASFSKTEIVKKAYSIQYYYNNKAVKPQEMEAVELSKEITINPEQMIIYNGKSYTLERTENNPLTVTENEKQNIIRVYYADDDNKDGIPDKYQVKVIYKAVNGSIDAAHDNEKNRTFYVNLYKDGNLATANEGGVGYLSEDQIATATAANGYAQDTLSWYPCAPTTDVPLQYETEFEASFSKTEIVKKAYRIQYYYDNKAGKLQEMEAVEVGKEVTLDPEQSVSYNGKSYTLERTENNPLTVTENEKQNIIKVYYAIDENKDDIADKYQVKVIYKAENGSIDKDHDNSNNRAFYVNLYRNGKLATAEEGGVGYLSEDQIATATAANGYAQDTLSWKPAIPSSKLPLQKETEFEASFSKITVKKAYRIQYYYDNKAVKPQEMEAVEVDKEIILNPEQTITYNGISYVLDRTENNPLTITDDEEQNVISVYYTADGNKDGIPDKYQAEVTFAAVNGNVDFDKVYVTLYDDKGKYSETGTGKLSERQIASVTPDSGYHFVNWTPDTPTIELEITKSGATFSAMCELTTHNATIRYINEDNGKMLAPTKTVNGIKPGNSLNGAEYKIDITGYAFTKADVKKIEADNAIINVYYSADIKGGETNPDSTSDGTPDKYQVRFEYKALQNGSVSGTMVEYVTRPNKSTAAAVKPQAMVTVTADEGYSFTGWEADGTTYLLTEALKNAEFVNDTVFTAAFSKKETPILPLPVLPTPPVEKPEIPATPLLPAEPATPIAPEETPTLPEVTPEVPATTPALPVSPVESQSPLATTPTTPALPATPAAPAVPGAAVTTPITLPANTPVPANTPEQTVTVDNPDQPQAGGEKTETVNENPTPKAGSESTWAFINLLCAGVSVLLGLLLLISKGKKEEEDDNNTSVNYKRSKCLRIAGCVTAVVSAIVFFLTEDVTLAMVLVDKWTLLMAAFLIVQLIFFVCGRKWKEKDSENKEEVIHA